jgi:hypothetical protein
MSFNFSDTRKPRTVFPKFTRVMPLSKMSYKLIAPNTQTPLPENSTISIPKTTMLHLVKLELNAKHSNHRHQTSITKLPEQ